uniref:histone acetyltransferase n=1 Tax=Angiostrongylus cantonensis TaxID=6313 RepID=A0A158PCH4_ANGCA
MFQVYAFFKNKLPNNFDQHVVTIPTLSIKAKEVKVKPLMKARYGPQGFPDHFSCRRKAVFAFEIIDKVEVFFFFEMYVQEYRTNCKEPNSRQVYISYLDSFNFFQTRELKRELHQEILLGYLDEVGDEVARRREEITEADEGVMFVSWATVERKGGMHNWSTFVVPIHFIAFLTIRLVAQQSAFLLPDITDPDPPVGSDMMDDRNTFLDRARDEHCKFSTLRRAKTLICVACVVNQSYMGIQWKEVRRMLVLTVEILMGPSILKESRWLERVVICLCCTHASAETHVAVFCLATDINAL